MGERIFGAEIGHRIGSAEAVVDLVVLLVPNDQLDSIREDTSTLPMSC